jgi:pyridoxamine 5'-phosphate oxidase
MKLEGLRQEYKRSQLLEASVDKNPVRQFEQWFDEAAKSGICEPNAVTVSTVNKDGRPSSRVVLLKGISDGGFVIYTNYQSQKARNIENNPYAYMNFLWIELERQVRISGRFEKVSREETEAYFHSRPRGSQIGAWVSHQSEVIASREVLEQNLALMEAKFADVEVIPVPEYWGGYRLMPDLIEFWQGRPSRLHDRILYTKLADDTWKIERLSP